MQCVNQHVATFQLLSTYGNAQNLKLLLGGGLEFGGDTAYELFFTDGGSSKGRTGQGGFIEAGGQYQFEVASKFLLRASLGFKFLLNTAENASTRITRFPLSLSGNWMLSDDIRLGVGTTTHLAAKVVGDGFFDDKDFNSSIGPRVELAYKRICAHHCDTLLY